MIEVEITTEMYHRAKQMASELGHLKGSITRGQSNVYGFLGEEIFHAVYPEATRENHFEYDFIMPDGRTVDVKTKKCKGKPLLKYESSVNTSKNPQQCDIYFFCRVKEDCTKAWICGWYPAEMYRKEAKHVKKGDHDPSNNWTCKRSCWNMEYKNLMRGKL